MVVSEIAGLAPDKRAVISPAFNMRIFISDVVMDGWFRLIFRWLTR
jgi:hypothetical protein